MKSQNSKFKIIESRVLADKWQEDVVLTEDNSNLRWLLLFTDKVPESVNIRVRLAGYRSRAEIITVYLGKKENHTNMDIVFIHDAPETYGRITAKAALFDQSKFTLRGMLEITPRGKGSDTYLSAKGLMVSPRARAEIYPYLEIETNEVRASHGTSVGRIDPRQLFYLQSRGLPKEEAEEILLAGYFYDIAAAMPPEYAAKFFQNAAAIEAKPL